MIRSFKVMLIPNNKQNSVLFNFGGASRFAYNWAIEQIKNNYQKTRKFIDDYELRRKFTELKKEEKYKWLYEISSNITKQAIKDACLDFKKFFKKYSKYPPFKSKKRNTSFYQDTLKIKFNSNHVKLEKITNSKKKNRQKLNWIKLAEKNRIPINSKYYNPRIKFDGLNWWLTIGVDVESKESKPNNEGIGIDLGIKDLAICSDGKKYENINKTSKVKKIEKSKKRLERSISRSYLKNKKDDKYIKTKNIIKKQKILLKKYHRLNNIRDNYINQVISKVIKREPKFIAVENLNVAGMLKNKHLSKSIKEQKFSAFKIKIERKCESNNIRFVLVDRFFPSSKMCIKCGTIKTNLKLKDRIYKCDCGNVIDRDYQASLNLKEYAEKNI